MAKEALKKITDRQKQILEIIYRSIKDNGFPPSFEELKEELAVSSNQAITDHLKSLENKGLISREEKSARGIKITAKGFEALKTPNLAPLLGTSYAGAFTESITLQGEWQELSKEVKQLKQEVFIVQVSGDSMIEAGINDGDQLLIQLTKIFKSGDIVLAYSNNGTTIKRFIKQNKPPFTYLKPENPKYQNILFTNDITMQGIVVGKFDNGKMLPLK